MRGWDENPSDGLGLNAERTLASYHFPAKLGRLVPYSGTFHPLRQWLP